jgi:hypothetical protein
MTKEEFKRLAEEHLFILEGYSFDKKGNKEMQIFGFDKLYKALNMHVVGWQSEQLFCENVIHHTCKWFDQYNGCMGCLVKKYEAK